MDLVATNYQCRTEQGLDDEGTKQEMAKAVHKKIKQMTTTEFLHCFVSASFNVKNKTTEITLAF